MEDEMILDESVIAEEVKEETNVEVIQEPLPKIQPRKNKNAYKEKECKVIFYNKRTNTLDIKFDNYGVRIKDVKDFSGDTIIIKYKGEIGKTNFEYKL